ncbi:ABC transporter permease [Marinovum sp. 2_MG-2023]|uniref:ABC transporter permease n=1 Tax=Roseobacteraceae TaxID=2854170 RepID=UPI001FD4A80C|nr:MULTISPECIES: ABC transporter permease [Roseobacteraceae]MCJ7874562.1 ABC transporter permease [Phaeobacter sp. J2-8]MDO6732260.1 ABC transporter permease [Marinovum sp. 2_MG-2023]MDO6781577.1 ABC transporter permease [Marinovum sp. 1_MG-2023]
MATYIIKRIFAAICLLFAVSIVSFMILQVPEGDYASYAKAMAISQGGMNESDAEAYAAQVRARYGLDQPVLVQYVRWIGNIVFAGDLGPSFAYNKPVAELIGERLPRTLAIAIVCHLLATLIGVALGILAAAQHHRLGDTIASTLAFVGMTVPRFFMALVILYYLAFVVGWPYIGSLYSPEYVFADMSWAKIWDFLKHVWPVILIATVGGLAYNTRVMRGNLLDVLRQPYIEAARAKGLKERTVIVKHAVPNALHPLIMHQGVILPYMLTGELEVAIILSIPTLGPLMYSALTQQDVNIVSSTLLILSAVLLIGNLLADLALAVLDPRIRYS